MFGQRGGTGEATPLPPPVLHGSHSRLQPTPQGGSRKRVAWVWPALTSWDPSEGRAGTVKGAAGQSSPSRPCCWRRCLCIEHGGTQGSKDLIVTWSSWRKLVSSLQGAGQCSLRKQTELMEEEGSLPDVNIWRQLNVPFFLLSTFVFPGAALHQQNT